MITIQTNEVHFKLTNSTPVPLLPVIANNRISCMERVVKEKKLAGHFLKFGRLNMPESQSIEL